MQEAQGCQKYFIEVVDCLKETDCIRKDGKPLRECYKSADLQLSEACINIFKRYSRCKRGQVWWFLEVHQSVH